MTAAALYGEFAVALLVGAAVSLLPLPRRRLMGLLAVAATAWLAAPVLHSLLGAPSFTLAQLALLRLAAPDRLAEPDWRANAAFVVVAAVFYTLALGVGPFDPFDLGYHPLPLLAALIPVGLVLAWRGEALALSVLGFDLLAYAFGLFDNLWNACLDPVLTIVAVFLLLRRMAVKPRRAVVSRAGRRKTREFSRPA